MNEDIRIPLGLSPKGTPKQQKAQESADQHDGVPERYVAQQAPLRRRFNRVLIARRIRTLRCLRHRRFTFPRTLRRPKREFPAGSRSAEIEPTHAIRRTLGC